MKESWQTLSEEEIDRNRWWSHLVRRFRTPDGREGEYHLHHSNSAVNVFAQDEHGRFVMIREYRYLFDRMSVAECQGGIEDGETPEAAALRELKEETGYEAGTIVKIGTTAGAPSFSDETLHLFYATDLTRVGEHDREVTDVVHMTAAEIDDAIRSGEIWDSHMIGPWYQLKLHLGL